MKKTLVLSLLLTPLLAAYTPFLPGSEVRAAAITSPTDISGNVMWLDASSITGYADGASLPAWPDLSGSGVTISQSNSGFQPLFRNVNGEKYVENVGGGVYGISNLPSMNVGQSSVFIVSKGVTNPQTDWFNQEFLFNLGSFGTHSVQRTHGQISLMNSSTYASGLPMPTSGFGVYTAIADAQKSANEGPGLTQQLDGLSSFRTNGHSGLGGIVASTVTTGGLFNYINSPGAYAFEGSIKAVLIYNRALNAMETTSVQDYLANKYNINNTVTPSQNLIFDGDSQTAALTGQGETKGYTDQVLMGQTRPFSAYNLGISGQSMASVNTNGATKVDPLYNLNAKRNVVVVWAGTNDIGGGLDPATTYSNLVAYSTARRNKGYKVVVVTALPRGTDAGWETARQTYNTSIRTNWSSFADKLIDLENADPLLGAPGAQNNTTYFNADRTHLTVAGYGRMATLVSAALNDTAAPTGSISINNGANQTSSLTANLSIPAYDALDGAAGLEMQVSGNASFTGASWEPYSSTKAWNLPAGEGTKSVYMKLRDSWGNTSSAYSSQILYSIPVAQPTATPTPAASPAAISLTGSAQNAKQSGNTLMVGTRPSFSGMAPAGSKVTVTVHSDPVSCSAMAATNGTWSCTLDKDIPEGNHTVMIEAITSSGEKLTLNSFQIQVVKSLAPTGSNTWMISLGALCAITISGAELSRRKLRSKNGHSLKA